MSTEIKQTEFGTQVGPVEFIWARNSKEFLFANSIYIKGKPSIIVDPSAAFTYIEQLATTHAVDMVLNTHYHADHRSLNGLFQKALFASHEADAAAIRSYETYEKIADPDPQSSYALWRKQVFQKYHIVDCPVAKLYQDKDVVETDATTIEVVHIPGHTPGHIALWFKDLKLLYISDIDLTPYGPWYANIVSDIDQFKDSVKKVMNIEADYYVTSHGERLYPPEKFHEKIERFYRQFDERDEKILNLLKEGPKELVHIASEAIVYRRPSLVDPLKAYFQWQMVVKHLQRLEKQGMIRREGEKYILAK